MQPPELFVGDWVLFGSFVVWAVGRKEVDIYLADRW